MLTETTTPAAPTTDISADAQLVLAALRRLKGAAFSAALSAESCVGGAYATAEGALARAGLVERVQVGKETLIALRGEACDLDVVKHAISVVDGLKPAQRRLASGYRALLGVKFEELRERQRAAWQAKCDARDAEIAAFLGRARELAARLGCRVVDQGDHRAFCVMFGEGPQRLLAGPGSLELRIEAEHARVEAADGSSTYRLAPLKVTPRAYSLDNRTTVDELEAHGRALVEAARFTRTLLALVTP